jgi:acid stress chaperone HdeB
MLCCHNVFVWTCYREQRNLIVDGMEGAAMKFLASALAAAMFACCNPALAEDIDLSTWTCKKFVTADKETIGIILTWLDGYYKDEDDPPVIETGKFVENAKKLAVYCGEHPDNGLITAADKVLNTD